METQTDIFDMYIVAYLRTSIEVYNCRLPWDVRLDFSNIVGMAVNYIQGLHADCQAVQLLSHDTFLDWNYKGEVTPLDEIFTWQNFWHIDRVTPRLR